eukprot:SAG11_NODE_32358_length_284_cov_0.837838_1_plen_44_part_01
MRAVGRLAAALIINILYFIPHYPYIRFLIYMFLVPSRECTVLCL